MSSKYTNNLLYLITIFRIVNDIKNNRQLRMMDIEC